MQQFPQQIPQQNYPTQWQLGKPRGSIKKQPTAYLVVMSPPNAKQTNTYFLLRDNNNDKLATLKKAEDFRYSESARYGLTRNQIRYIDANTIEVQLTKNFVMITDANLLAQVEKYPLSVIIKKEKSIDRHYVMAKNIKKAFPFTDLICNYKIVEYINRDTLDLRLSNLKEFGTISNDNKNLIINKNVAIDEYDMVNQYEYFNIRTNNLPKNIWLLGKPSGSVFTRKEDNIYTARVVDDDDKQHTKTFNIAKYKNNEEAYKAARKWQFDTSYALGLTKNLIKILDNDVIAVQLTKNHIMKTDKIFIPLLQKILVCSAKSGNGYIYAIASINDVNIKFHKLITGFDMVDHIDGNKLNNCLDNLRNADYSMNNTNRHSTNENSNTKCISIKGPQNDKYYSAKIKIDGIAYKKSFSINEHGEENAKKLAIEFREKLCDHTKFKSIITPNDDPQLMNIELAKLKYILELVKQGMIFNKKEYLKTIPLLDDDLNKIHGYYISHQLKYSKWLYDECERISQLLINKQI